MLKTLAAVAEVNQRIGQVSDIDAKRQNLIAKVEDQSQAGTKTATELGEYIPERPAWIYTCPTPTPFRSCKFSNPPQVLYLPLIQCGNSSEIFPGSSIGMDFRPPTLVPGC